MMAAVFHERLADSLIGGMAEARLEWHMANWARWMRHDQLADAWPHRAIGCIGGGYSTSLEDMEDEADLRCARAVDALVTGLCLAERIAVQHTYLHAVFRLPRHSLPVLLERARTTIASGLVRRGIY